MRQLKERRWTSRWGSVSIVKGEGYFHIALYFWGMKTIISFARSDDEN